MKDIQENVTKLAKEVIVDSLQENELMIASFQRKKRKPEIIDASGFAVDMFPQQFGSMSLALIPTDTPYEEVLQCSYLGMYLDCSEKLDSYSKLKKLVTNAMEGDIFISSGLSLEEMEHVIFLGVARAIMSQEVVQSLNKLGVAAYAPDLSGFKNLFGFYVFNRESANPKPNYCDVEMLSRYVYF